ELGLGQCQVAFASRPARRLSHKILKIGKFCLPGTAPESTSRISDLQSKFPTSRNREIIVPEQGIKSAHQGNFAPDQGSSHQCPAEAGLSQGPLTDRTVDEVAAALVLHDPRHGRLNSLGRANRLPRQRALPRGQYYEML